MYAIAGVTGHVGGHAARTLLDRGEPVRVLVRNAAKGADWARRGADVAVADLSDAAAVADALRGCRGAFVLLPAAEPEADFHTEQRALADAITEAVIAGQVPHVVMLSSVGAELPEGTGPILPLHYLENRLRTTGAIISALRSFHFQEKVETVLEAVLNDGIYPNFGESADVPRPMNATHDIGVLVADTLLSPPSSSEVVDVVGPEYTERRVAEVLSAILGREIPVVNIPRAGWVDAIASGGVSRHFAEVLAGLHDAEERGILQSSGDRVHRCHTELEQTLREIVPEPATAEWTGQT
ncbi:NmrA family NAD(P)-binding protein [Phytoactinopolyspora halotolerans]|uniref:NAD(P)H-binding protein n=1 Tax=Phytoactinopolyspora halotolerans TaxID=1981512 RepID=A0A6L9S333_9ACTN|nr:NAD(P)H-binding protein [Phytoactinopolyspora halotolerans]NED99043.1 NAD(P)H-binding protein [Phytoactinopolyspora halotolerans]